MVSNTATNFENSKHRRIYQGARGGFFIRRQKPSGGDEKVYHPVAKFRTNADGHASKLSNENRNKVPSAIRPAVRKTRKSGGLGALVKRHANNVPNMIVNLPNNKNNRGFGGLVALGPSPNNVMMMAPPPRVRKTRKNKGVKRGPRKAKAG
jgi:hypothetical protein